MRSSWSQRLQRLDAFQKLENTYQSSSSSGGLLSVAIIAAMLFMFYSELSEYLRYKQQHTFSVDSNMRHPLQINLGIAVAMPCPLVRVDVLDVSGTSRNVQPNIRLLPVLQNDAFDATQRRSSLNSLASMHVHDIIAEAGHRQRPSGSPQSLSRAKNLNSLDGTACFIEGSVMVDKVSGLLHITAHGYGHGGMHVPARLLNFTHHIHELSFGPLYPSLVNPLDSTRHTSSANLASFKYFISVVPTTYISPDITILETNQYAVNEYYREQGTFIGEAALPPGIFFEYNVEPIAVTVRETRKSLAHFFRREGGQTASTECETSWR
ncbi:hypothetical protein GGI07_005394 [Coemansia sp. Benny D115]|nr:hypothetical protein GGI07_005394 [Coemansia sp. Benny D115]